MIVRCLNRKDYEDLKLYMERVARVMIEYEWLINTKLIDYYINESWSRLPSSWQDYLSELSASHLAQWLTGERVPVRKVMPLSLQCFQKVADQLSFARQESSSTDLNRLAESLSDGYAKCETDKPIDQSSQQYKITDLNRIDLRQIFTKNLKIKKQHEVGRFSSLIRNVLEPDSVQLVDFGSGRGHLARFLSLYFGFQVTTLELEESTSQRAAELDRQAVEYCENQNKKADQNMESVKKRRVPTILPKHLNVRVTSDLELNLAESSTRKVAAIGLHACGSLSRDMIELFKGGFADYLFLVSCCYHLNGAKDGKRFLLSEAASNSLANFRNFNHETKEIACHSLEQSIDELKGKFFFLNYFSISNSFRSSF